MNHCHVFPLIAHTPEFRNFSEHGCDLRVTHKHHIWGGTRRINRKANLIRVCRTVHTFIHNHPNEGRLACLLSKLRHGCLELAVLDECAGRSTIGWLECQEFSGPWAMWKREVIEWASKH